MKRIILAALALLTFSLLGACADTGSSPSQADIDATVEARVAEALSTYVSNPTPTPVPIPSSGRIAFSSNRDGNYEIYVMNTDGSGLTRITNDSSVDDSHPSWSPDGQRIAFESDGEIYVMDANRSAPARLTDLRSASRPSWSPDGRRISFRSNQGGDDWDIYVMNADGSDITRLTHQHEDESHPSWSSDGQRIAFESEGEIYVMNADGSDITLLTDDSGDDIRPSWSPDGQRIAFTSYREWNWDVYVMNADGTNIIRLTNDPGNDHLPSWSPDGQRIA
ncbi:MAG: hypothetical protein F4X94_08445, partial [Dehalococcoidia bacterium]|nr:hypothetical protein [Dehalococcoidia bacterium]